MGPITFLNPGLLAGAAAAAVPIVLHLWQRRRPRRLPYSDLRFLEEGQARRARRLGLRRWLLLLVRVLAIVAVATAAARPRLAGLARAPGGPLSAIFVLDASASMQTQEEQGTRFAQAARLCAGLAAALPPGSETQVVLAGPVAAPLFADWLPASALLGESLAAAAPTDGGCNLAAALREALRWAAAAPHPPAEIFLLSDLQKSAALPDSAALGASGRALSAADGPRLLLRRVGSPAGNGGVRSVTLPLRALRAGEAITIGAEVRLERAPESFLLELDGERVAEAVATAPAMGGVGRVEFALTAPAPGRHRLRVVKRSDRLPVDDDRPCVLFVRDRVAALIVHGADRGEAAGRGGWRYLARALDPGPPEGGGDGSLFAVRDVDSKRLAEGDLVGTDVVLLVDPEPPGRSLLGELQRWIEAGGGVALFLGDPTLSDAWSGGLLPALGLPGPARFAAREGGAQERARVVDPGHPVFAGLGEEPLATLADVRWRRFHVLPEDSAQVLLAFSGGAPALLESRRGAGVVCLLPFDLLTEASDLPLSPMFLPLAQRLAAWLADQGGGGGALLVGEVPRVRLSRAVPGGRALADLAALRVAGPAADAPATAGAPGAAEVLPAAATVAAPARLDWRGGAAWLTGAPTSRRGFYVFTAGGDTVGLVAAAPPASEGDPELWDPGACRAALAGVGVAAADPGDLRPETLGAALAGRDLSAWFLALALLLLLAELALGRGTGESASGG